MKKFKVRFKTAQGEEEIRLFTANSLEEASQIAEVQGIVPLEVSEESSAMAPPAVFWGGVPLSEIYHFTRLFGTMIRAGIPILETLDMLRGRTENAKLKDALNRMFESIQGGSSLGTAFSDHPDVFDFTYQNLIKVGEESGELPKTLDRLVGLLDRRIKLRRAIQRALTYPALVVGISGVVTWGILTYIVPKFRDIYKKFGGDLPVITQITIGTSDFLVNHSLLFFGILAGLAVSYLIIGKTKPGRALIDRVQLALPLLGPMYHTYEIAQFSKSFSILIHSGVTVTSSLEILSPAISKEPIRRAVNSSYEGIKAGKTMGDSFGEQFPMIPDLFHRMISVGERSGNLTEMLDHIALFYEEEFYNKVETLASLIEPIMIVFLGVIIGGIVISLYLPIFGMAKLITRR